MNRFNENKRMGAISIFGYIITAVSAIIIPLLLVPGNNRSPYFWLRIIWIEILTALAWGVIGGLLKKIFISKIKLTESSGILPALGMIILGYIGISFLLTVGGAFTPDTFISGRYFLIAQILAFVLATVICVFLMHADSASSIGPEAIDNVIASRELCLLLQAQEDRLSEAKGYSDSHDELEKIRNEIKLLKEKFKYSINHAGSFKGNQEYLLLADNIKILCTDISNLDLSGIDNRADLILLGQRAIGLRSIANRVAIQ